MPIVVTPQGDGIAVLTMSKPKTLNSMDLDDVREMRETLDELARDDSCRVIVLTGAGRGFCSGHELSEMQEEFTVSSGWLMQEAFANLTRQLRSVPQATVAAINGPAAGGGLALALACDTRVCAESATFNAAFVRIGLSGCDVGVSYLLPRIVGPTLAFEMMLTGRLVAAQEALRSRLVLDVVPDGEVVNAALEIAGNICRNAPFAVRMTKQVMWDGLDAPDLDLAIHLENRTQLLCAFDPGFKKAIDRFAEALAQKRSSKSGPGQG
jgi:enoyl-CoA hydratase